MTKMAFSCFLPVMNQYVGMLRYQKILRRTQFVVWPFWGCCIYLTVIVRTPRLLCMMVQYVGMLQYQNIFRQTQFVGCRAKNRQTRRKKAFWSFMVILGVLQLLYSNSQDTKTSVYDHTQMDTICRMQSKKQVTNKKKGILVIYGHFGGALDTIR